MMGYLVLLAILGHVEIPAKMVQLDLLVYQGLSGLRVIEDPLALQVHEDFKGCQGLRGNLVSLVKMGNLAFLVNLE
jgi:hypothetical protein